MTQTALRWRRGNRHDCKANAMSFIRCLVVAAAVGCGLTTMEASGGDDKPPAFDEAPIKAVVAHFAKNGVKLKADERGWWVVTDPKGDGYEVIVRLRTF